MSSVRSRWEREFHRQESREAPAPARPRSPLTTAAITQSTREHDRAAAFQAAGPEILPKLGPRAEQMSSSHVPTVTSVRSRLDQRAEQEARSQQPTRTAAAEFYLAEYDREQANKKQRELDEEKRNRDLIARNK